MRKFWGFDKPLGEQYLTFIAKAVTGDFGTSYLKKLPAMEVVINRLGYTWMLAAASAAIGLTIAVPLGVLSALKRNSLFDLAITSLSSLGTAMPSFWLGLMLIIIFGVHLRMLPVFGALEPKAIIMPSVTLGVGMAARLSRMTRSGTCWKCSIKITSAPPTAKACCTKRSSCVMRCATALIPIVTVFGLQLGWLLGGSVVVESVFSWPGLGRLMIESISVRDNTVVQAGLLWIALSFILINYAIDVIYIMLDPRIKFQ